MKICKSLTCFSSHGFVRIFCVITLFVSAQSCFFIAKAEIKSDIGARNPRWARPLEKPGLPNLYKVSEDLYRGAQPSAEGMKELKKLGIRTVVNLRTFHSDRDEIGDMDLAYEHIRMLAFYPREKPLVRFLRIVADKDQRPVFVHCMHGADRTGLVAAAYRIVVEGWTKGEAVEEMTQGGFGFHSFLINLVPFIKNLDVAKLQKKAGLQK